MFTKRVISSIRHACKPLSILTKISTTEAVLPYRLQTLLFVNPTNTRFCSTVRGKSFTETENNYVYQVLNGIPGVDNALLGNEQKIIDEAMFTSYLNKDWRNSTATDILQAFKTVKPFCQQQDITFNDPRFDSLVNGLMDHCEKLTDKELLELLRCVSEYPACSAFSSHNYHDIWSCLDDICCWKMGTWDIDTMFACADLWFKLKLGKVSDFIFELLDRLTRKADMLTKDQLVRLFFYFNICRKRPVDFEYEHALQNKIHEMNVDEMAVVALGFFKSQSRIKLLPILEAMVKKLTSTAMGVHEISLTAIMKVLRLSYATKILPQINTMLDSLCPELDRLSDVACLHVALLSTGLQTFHGDILSKCSQKLVENLPNTRLKELERILNVLTMFAFDPQTKPDIFKAAYRELHRDSRKQEIDQFPRCLASALHYLSLRGIYAHTLLDKVLDNEFITNNFGKHAKLLPQQLFFLDASVDIECPDYKGNRLLPPLKYKAAKWQTQWPPSYDQYKKITPKDQLFLDTVDAVKNIVGGSDLLRVEHVLPHFPMADIIVCKDTKTDTYSKPIGFEKYILGDIMKPFNDGTLKWYAIVVLTWNSTMRENGAAPLGHASMKLRQLEKIGYTPLTRRSGNRNTLITMAVVTMVILVVIGVVVGVTVTKPEKELKMVHIIMRHGIRTPADTYPTDPHINDTLYPVGWGQLTNEGKLQLYEIGKYFRQRYGKFLGDQYWPNEYYTQSTDVDRTKASMQLVNAGLWPPKSVQVWGPLDWQPIPVHAEPLSQDMLLLVRKPCAAYHKERDKVIATEEIQSKFKDNQALFDALTKHTGRTIKDFDDVQDLYSTLKAEESFNLTLPDWTKEFYPDKLIEPTIFSFILNAWNDKMNRLKGGLLLKKVLDDWTSKESETNSASPNKAFLYGGHDSTIVNFMRALKVWDSQLPGYAITILLELSIDEGGTYGVEVYLRNSTEVAPFKLTIPGCESFCPLSRLTNLTNAVIPENWQKECDNDGSYDVPEPGGP